MKRLIVAVVLFVLSPGLGQDIAVPKFVIQHPTIVAFFPPTTDTDLEKNPDLNEVLGDFQLYATRVGRPLRNARVTFEVTETTAFRIQVGNAVRVFRTGKIGIGYYFIAPGKEPHVEYGVMTDDGILEMAERYFDLKIDK